MENASSPLFQNRFALLSASICHVCLSRRGLYNKCVCDGDLQRDRMGYTDMEQKSPAAIFFVGLAVVVLAGLLGLQGNSNVTLGLELMFTSERGRPKDQSVNVCTFILFRPPREDYARFPFIALKHVGACVIGDLSPVWPRQNVSLDLAP